MSQADQTQEAINQQRLVQTEILISTLLRYGVLICGFVIALGLGLMLFGSHSAESIEAIAKLRTGAVLPDLVPSFAIFRQILVLDGAAIATAGLMLLIALPILRVALTMFLFIFEKDWIFFGITLVVLTVLITGLVLGKEL